MSDDDLAAGVRVALGEPGDVTPDLEIARTEGEFSLDRPVRLHPLTFLDEGDDVTVGRADIDSYAVLPADGAFVLQRLGGGITPRQVVEEYERRYHQEVDLGDFLDAMDDLGFLVQAGEPVAAAAAPPRGRRAGQILFSRTAFAGYTALGAAAVVTMIRHPDLLPTAHHLFFSPYITLVTLTLFVAQVPFLLVHELFHMLAGRRLGLRSRLGIGRRLYFVVFETSMDGLVTVPRRQRYLPILAGMLADLLAVAALTLTAAILRGPHGEQPLAGRLCLALAFTAVLRFAWQFYFYLQTDLYQVVVTVCGCVDLHNAARVILRNRLYRAGGRRERLVDEGALHPRDRQVGRWYSWLLLAGYSVSLVVLVLTAVPVTIHVVSTELGRLSRGDTATAAHDDALGFVVVNLLQFVVLVWVVLRERRRRRADPPRDLVDRKDG